MAQCSGYGTDSWVSISPYGHRLYDNGPMSDYAGFGQFVPHELPESISSGSSRMPPPQPDQLHPHHHHHQLIQPAPAPMAHQLPMLNTAWPSQLTNPTPTSSAASYSAPPLPITPVFSGPPATPAPPPADAGDRRPQAAGPAGEGAEEDAERGAETGHVSVSRREPGDAAGRHRGQVWRGEKHGLQGAAAQRPVPEARQGQASRLRPDAQQLHPAAAAAGLRSQGRRDHGAGQAVCSGQRQPGGPGGQPDEQLAAQTVCCCTDATATSHEGSWASRATSTRLRAAFVPASDGAHQADPPGPGNVPRAVHGPFEFFPEIGLPVQPWAGKVMHEWQHMRGPS